MTNEPPPWVPAPWEPPPWEPSPWAGPRQDGTPTVDEAAYGVVEHGNSQYGSSPQGRPSTAGYASWPPQPGPPPHVAPQSVAPPNGPQYGSPQYAQYGPPAWGQQHGQPYGAYPYPPAGPPRRSAGKVGWSIAGVLVLVALVVAVFMAVGSAIPDEQVAAPAAGQRPTGLGGDPALDELAESCHGGAMAACDDLYTFSDVGSDYEEYGDTCAGRRESGAWAMCADVFLDAE